MNKRQRKKTSSPVATQTISLENKKQQKTQAETQKPQSSFFLWSKKGREVELRKNPIKN